jgi:hypothetical protein
MPISIVKERQTKSGSFSNGEVRKQIASEIVALMPFVRGTQQEKLRAAKRMVARLLKVRHTDIDNPKLRIGTRNFLLRQSAEILDNPNKSHTPGPGSDLGNQPVKDKIPPASTYQSYAECVGAITSPPYNVDAAIASNYCKSVNADSGTSGPDTIQSGGRKKSASSLDSIWIGQSARAADTENYTTEVPYWVSAIMDDSDLPKQGSGNNIRSAVIAKEVLAGESIESILERNRMNREEAVAAKTRLLNAKKNEGIPAWAVVAGGI